MTWDHREGDGNAHPKFNLTDELDRFVLEKVESRRYQDASEVVRQALRTLEREEQEYEAKLAALRTAVDEGDASGIAEGDAFAASRNDPPFDTAALACGRVSSSRRAEADLLSIGAYTLRTWGMDQAIRYTDDL